MEGILAINKPVDIFSTRVVEILRRTFGEKVGHAGTLDPFAEGVLLILIGTTRVSNYAMRLEKEYMVKIVWGENRDTLDRDGRVIESSNEATTSSAIEKALKHFVGVTEQTPPRYSAIKIHGKRAYDLARLGKDFNCEKRFVFLKRAEILSHDKRSTVLKLITGKGFYVRSLVRDLARRLGVLGYASELVRSRIGSFTLENSISIDPSISITSGLRQKLTKSIFTKEELLQAVLPRYQVSLKEAISLVRGKKILSPVGEGLIVVYFNSEAISICEVKGRYLKPIRVFLREAELSLS